MSKQKAPHVDNLYLMKQLDGDYLDGFNRVYDYLMKSDKAVYDRNIIANIALDQCLEGKKSGKKASLIIPKDVKDYVSKYSKGTVYKEMKKKLRNQDYEKYSISSIWLVFTLCIVLFFLKNLMMQEFLINYAVDVVVACLAGGFALQNYLIKRRIINRYHFGSFYTRIDVITLIACVFVKLISTSNFDITYLMLVIAFFVSKRKIKVQFEEVVS